MMRVFAAFALLVCVHGFAPAPLLALKRSAPAAMRMRLDEADFVPSETWYREYLGQDGLRYSMGKADSEIAESGDYSFFEAMFGQTSNNAAKKALKEEARKAAYKVKDPDMSSFWLNKYGHPRFFPAYIDKSGEDQPQEVVGTAGTVVDVSKTAANTKEGKSKTFGPGTSSFPFMPKSQPSKPATKNVPNVSPMPKIPPVLSSFGSKKESKPSAAAAAAPKAQVKAAAAKATAAPKATARVVAAKVTETAAAVAPRRERASAPKAKGNLSNLPTKKRA